MIHQCSVTDLLSYLEVIGNIRRIASTSRPHHRGTNNRWLWRGIRIGCRLNWHRVHGICGLCENLIQQVVQAEIVILGAHNHHQVKEQDPHHKLC